MALPSLTCPECGHLNEGERIYCHNCGVKLDRSAVIAEEQKRRETAVPAEKTQDRVKKLINPNADKPAYGVGSFISGAIRTLLFAALVALLITVLLPPAEVPPMPELAAGKPLPTLVQTLVNAPPNMRLVLKESDINDFLRATVRMGKAEGLLANAMEFQRVYTAIDPEGLQLTLQRALYGYPLYVGAKYRLEIAGGKLEVTQVGGNIGRLTVPPVVFPYFEKLLGSVWDTFKEEREQMNRLGKVETAEDELILYSPSVRTASPVASGPGSATGAGAAPARPAGGQFNPNEGKAPLGHPAGSKPVGFGDD